MLMRTKTSPAAPAEDPMAKIGVTAGAIWHLLDSKGPLKLPQLVKKVSEPRDTVMQALGWLAREGKIEIQEKGRQRTVALPAA